MKRKEYETVVVCYSIREVYWRRLILTEIIRVLLLLRDVKGFCVERTMRMVIVIHIDAVHGRSVSMMSRGGGGGRVEVHVIIAANTMSKDTVEARIAIIRILE